jgi:hypothetical protein
LPLLLAAAACGSPQRNTPSGERDADAPRTSYADEAAMQGVSPRGMAAPDAPPGAPGIAPTAAPGVALNYRYAFRLPANRIAQVQEEHAAACEKLGVARCRITGMLYRLVNDRDIEGRLAFKLDPALARAFGKQGIEAVTRAAGMLVESEISGEDAGSRIAAATRSEGDLQAELDKVEQQLARTGLKPQERAELQARAGQLRDQLRALKAGKAGDQEALASTPVVFSYGSGDLAPGFGSDSPVSDALKQAWGNVVAGFAAMLIVVITLLPWAVLLALLVLAWRRLAPRLPHRTATTEAAAP